MKQQRYHKLVKLRIDKSEPFVNKKMDTHSTAIICPQRYNLTRFCLFVTGFNHFYHYGRISKKVRSLAAIWGSILFIQLKPERERDVIFFSHILEETWSNQMDLLGDWVHLLTFLIAIIYWMKMTMATYPVLQLSCTWHSRYSSSLTTDVPEHSEHHHTQEQKVQACADSRKNNEPVLEWVKEMLIGKTEIYDNSVLIVTTDQQNCHKFTVASKLDLMKRSKNLTRYSQLHGINFNFPALSAGCLFMFCNVIALISQSVGLLPHGGFKKSFSGTLLLHYSQNDRERIQRHCFPH